METGSVYDVVGAGELALETSIPGPWSYYARVKPVT